MKSYQNHLESTKSYGEVQSVTYRPVMRSSAVFPLIHKPGRIRSIYTFMGYWLRKRNIPLVTVLLTIRDKTGNKVSVQSVEVSSVKSYVISSSNIIDEVEKDFIGSVEIEIFSAVDMVFPYPAVTFALRGVNGLSFVHTCGRIYNDFDDFNSNNEQSVAETGFDLYIGKDYKPFFSFVNGPVAIENKEIELEFINENDVTVIKKIIIEGVKPYGLGWVNLNFEKIAHLKEGATKICVKVRHNFEGFFPRFVAGNVLRNFEDVSLTHSYYDTSTDISIGAIWNNSNPDKFFDSVVAVPFDARFSEIELAVYPNFTICPVELMFELCDSHGEILVSKNSSIKLGTNSDSLTYLKFYDIFVEYRGLVSEGMVRVVFNGQGSVPTRMKFGLNFSSARQKTNLPSNICFNAAVPNEKMLEKPSAFRWCAIFDAKNQMVFLHNTSFVRDGFRDAIVDVELCRVKDDKKLQWTVNVPYNGTVEVLKRQADVIEDFLCGEIGWAAFSCSSPFVTGYYITDYKMGVVGADHLY
jgi:hypothetical protein